MNILDEMGKIPLLSRVQNACGSSTQLGTRSGLQSKNEQLNCKVSISLLTIQFNSWPQLKNSGYSLDKSAEDTQRVPHHGSRICASINTCQYCVAYPSVYLSHKRGCCYVHRRVLSHRWLIKSISLFYTTWEAFTKSISLSQLGQKRTKQTYLSQASKQRQLIQQVKSEPNRIILSQPSKQRQLLRQIKLGKSYYKADTQFQMFGLEEL